MWPPNIDKNLIYIAYNTLKLNYLQYTVYSVKIVIIENLVRYKNDIVII